MRQMEIGDIAFFYHSRADKEIVGIVEICALAHQDSSTEDERWDCVDIKALRPLKTPVTLAMCKADERLSDMILVNNSRLSVQPVTADEWAIVCALGGTDP